MRLKAVHKKHAEKQKMLQLQQEALTQQMNPHFIFNALGSVQNSILKGNTVQANSYLVKFSRLLRSGLNASRSHLIVIEDDAELMKNYLNVEQTRLGENFTFEVDVHLIGESYSLQISPFLLQTFIENGIKHGIGENHEAGRIKVAYIEKDDCVECSIEDNGIGRKASSNTPTDHRSHGSQIAFERIELFNKSRGLTGICRTEDLYDENGQPSGTRVVFTVPKINQE